MARMTQGIPAVTNGISQQPASIRHLSQGEAQVNGWSSLVTGLGKRPPTKHVAKLRASTTSGTIHLINRSATERAVVVMIDKDYFVYAADGGAFTDNTAGALRTSITAAAGYLDVPSADTDFRLTTVADTTFIVNTEKTVAEQSAGSAPTDENWLYIYAKQNVPDVKTVVELYNGSTWDTFNYTVGATGSTEDIASNLQSSIDANANWNAVRSGSLVVVRKNAGGDFDWRVKDSWGDRAVVAWKREIQDFDRLPYSMPEAITSWSVSSYSPFVKIANDPDNPEDAYYVTYADGVWTETKKVNGITPGPTQATMPLKLTITSWSSETFEIEEIDWAERKVGDDTTSPHPAFVGTTIKDVFFHKNRLGFVADENVIMSKTGEYFDFYRDTILQVLDTDPIDVGTNSTKVALIHHAIPYAEQLLLFSDQTQFILSSQGPLAPKSVTVNEATQFESRPLCNPVGAGANVYFATPNGDFDGLREYFVTEDAVTNDAANVTAHVQEFLPSGTYRLSVSNLSDTLLALTTGDRNRVYVYKYFWSGDEKVQSSWSYWEFDSGDTVLSAEIADNQVWFLINRSDGLYLETMDLGEGVTDTGLDFQVLLDRRTELTGVYSSANDETTWTLPYADTGTFQVVKTNDFPNNVGEKINGVTHPTSTTLVAPGDWSGGKCYCGRVYEHNYTFSEQFIRSREDRAVLVHPLMLQELRIRYSDTGYFRVEVTPDYGDTFTYPMTGNIIGRGDLLIGEGNVHAGVFDVEVGEPSDEVTIRIVNDSYRPSRILSAEWTGRANLRARRV